MLRELKIVVVVPHWRHLPAMPRDIVPAVSVPTTGSPFQRYLWIAVIHPKIPLWSGRVSRWVAKDGAMEARPKIFSRRLLGPFLWTLVLTAVRRRQVHNNTNNKAYYWQRQVCHGRTRQYFLPQSLPECMQHSNTNPPNLSIIIIMACHRWSWNCVSYFKQQFTPSPFAGTFISKRATVFFWIPSISRTCCCCIHAFTHAVEWVEKGGMSPKDWTHGFLWECHVSMCLAGGGSVEFWHATACPTCIATPLHEKAQYIWSVLSCQWRCLWRTCILQFRFGTIPHFYFHASPYHGLRSSTQIQCRFDLWRADVRRCFRGMGLGGTLPLIGQPVVSATELQKEGSTQPCSSGHATIRNCRFFLQCLLLPWN